MKKLDITEYTLQAPVTEDITCAVLSDLHGEEYGYILEEVRKRDTKLILIPGDVTHSHVSTPESCLAFFRDCAAVAPTYFSFGNHENFSGPYVKRAASEAGVTLLDNEYAEIFGLTVGGLTSGYLYFPKNKKQGHFRKTPPPKMDFLAEFDALPGYKILLCHHPEYYPEYLRKTGIPLILSGHAHGGQWRFFGRPVFAPGQRFFPKYAQGFHENRLIVSRGLANNGPAPRFFNNRELIFLHFRKGS